MSIHPKTLGFQSPLSSGWLPLCSSSNLKPTLYSALKIFYASKMSNAHFGKLLSLMQKRLLTTSATLSPTSSPSSSSSSFTVQYLTNSFGLSLESALSVTNKLQLDQKSTQKVNNVLEFLKSHGFDDTQISKLIEKSPAILQTRIRSNLRPKFEFLMEKGFVGSLLAELLVSNPVILKRGLDSHIKLAFEFLHKYLDSKEKVMFALNRSSWLLTSTLEGTIKQNVAFMIKEGVPESLISKLIQMHPRTVLQKRDNIAYAVKMIKGLGVEPKSPMFIHAFRVMVSMSELTWKKKVEVYKSVGWTDEQILSGFKRYPNCFTVSEEKIRSVMDFYVNTMKLDPTIIISYPKFVMYALDKRLRPRYNVLKILEEKGLFTNKKNKMAWSLYLSEKKFLEEYVIKHVDEVPDLLEIYGAAKEKK